MPFFVAIPKENHCPTEDQLSHESLEACLHRFPKLFDQTSPPIARNQFSNQVYNPDTRVAADKTHVFVIFMETQATVTRATGSNTSVFKLFRSS